MPKKIVVLGASGQDGSYMVEYLLANTQDTVIAAVRRTSQASLDNLSTVLSNPRLKVLSADITDAQSINALIVDERPDYLINLAGLTFVTDSAARPTAAFEINALSLINLLEAVRRHAPDCRVFSAGSSEQGTDGKTPRSLYGVTKATAGMICRQYREAYGLYVVHGILLNHESPRRSECFLSRKVAKGVARIAKAIKDGQPFDPIEVGNLDAARDWNWAPDVVDGIWRTLNQIEYECRGMRARGFLIDYEPNPPPKDYVLCSGKSHTVREFVTAAFAAAGIDGHWDNPTGESQREAYAWEPEGIYAGLTVLVKINPAYYRPDNPTPPFDPTPARRYLGWSSSTPFSEIAARMVRAEMAALGLDT